jgi:hypothetical protein
MSFTAGKRCAPTLIILALVTIVAFLVFLATAKSHAPRPKVNAPLHSPN